MSDSAPDILPFFSSAPRAAAGRQQGPAMLVVSGGRPGVGATTLAIHLAKTLAQDALRIALIDADLERADLALASSLSGGLGIGDVLAGRKTIHEVLQRGPDGLQILAGTASAETRAGLNDRTIARLLRQMRTLAPHVDWLLVDAGNQVSELASRLWTEADHVLLVTSADAAAVMDTYALVKTLLSRQALRRPPALVVNQVADDRLAADVHRRIDQSCRRFLGLAVTFAGSLPYDPAAASAIHSAAKLPLATALARLAKQLLEAREPSSRQRLAA
jgi:flagellar biosynthesis protein FlhG